MGFFSGAVADARGLTEWIKRLDGEVCCVKEYPKKNPRFGYFGGLDRRVAKALQKRGIEKLYLHQSRAVECALAGCDVVVVTPTASGKTLCYNLPVADSIVRNQNARALYLFPTKALAQDQLSELARFSESLQGAIKSFTYDGDTPADRRKIARSSANVIITNPDMLSAGILPHHSAWAEFFQNLQYVVVDELHSYRGIFGSHLANLFGRLERICNFYGSHPVFICCSATIANPKEHAQALTGRKMQLVCENGAPSSAKAFMLYNPKLLDKKRGIRRSSMFETARIAAKALCSGISTIIFTRSRLNVELLLKTLRRKLHDMGENPDIVAGYRGGYLPRERRAIEKGLRTGELRGVVSTNALELGVDIGALDFAILHGYPGSVASMRQQIGRAGRREEFSASVMVAAASDADRFFAANPKWLLDAPSEVARIDAFNPYIQVNHIRCSAFELPFRQNETFCGKNISAVLEYFAKHGLLSVSGEGENRSYRWQSSSYPAAGLSMRSATSQIYEIVDVSDARRVRIIGTMDKASAMTLIFPGAIYFHAGQSYLVQTLDGEKLECRVKLTNCDYYTEGESTVRILITKKISQRGNCGFGEATLATAAKMYRKIRLTTRETIGHGEINLPEEQMKTTVCWFAMPAAFEEKRELSAALKGLCNLLKNVAPFILMCDKNDIQITYRLNDNQLGKSALFIADNIPGGVGLAEGAFDYRQKLLDAALDAVTSCKCDAGCPACIGGESSDAENLKEIVCNLIKAVKSLSEGV